MLQIVSDIAYESLIKEAKLSPKPGLVDAYDNGSHLDMDYSTFLTSATALKPYFHEYLLFGCSYNGSASELFDDIRSIGIRAEKSMFSATQGINTHKGANFLFGVVLSAIGYGNFPNIDNLVSIIKQMTKGLVNRELGSIINPSTFGERMYIEHGIRGIRGEVEDGLPLVVNHCMPLMILTDDEDYNLKNALLKLISINDDTNMLKRGGNEGLTFGKKLANQEYSCINSHLEYMNNEFVGRNLSPGGSADLLAITYFLHKYNKIINTERILL